MEILYTWEFQDKKDRWAYWYVIALSIVIGIFIWWIITHQYWLSFIVLFLSGIIYYVENNSDDEVQVYISDLWIQISQNFYEYWKIDNYTYIYSWNVPVILRLNLNKVWLKNLDLRINEKIFHDLQNVIPLYLSENWKEEMSLSEKIVYKLKI